MIGSEAVGEEGHRTSRTAILAALLLSVAAPAVAAVCDGPPAAIGANIQGPDYLPRLELSDPSGAGGECALPLPALLPGTAVLALRASNLVDGATGARLRLIASEPIIRFAAAAGLAAVTTPQDAGTGIWALDVRVSGAAFCGPAVLGEVELAVRAGCAGLWADLTGVGGEGLPTVVLAQGGESPALCAHHGAYAGRPDLYHCQRTLCPEPNEPVRDFAALTAEGPVLQLDWTAGGGDLTVIRYRSDGLYPVSLADGRLLVAIPTVPGRRYSYLHENPEAARYWYAAFAVTISGEAFGPGSQLECGSLASVEIDPSVAVSPVSWGGLKRLYH